MLDQKDVEIEDFEHFMVDALQSLLPDERTCKQFVDISTSYMIINLVAQD